MNYKRCKRCVMDTSVKDIYFDNEGICNYCKEYEINSKNIIFEDKEIKEKKLKNLIKTIKTISKGQEYDCIIGLSGGADSTYVAYLVKQYALKPLVIHMDNGWNSETAVRNIENTVNKLGFDLYTHVIDWNEFKSLQLAYFKAGVLDIEALTDHAIGVIIRRLAKQYKIKYFLSGTNMATESMMPQSWFFDNKMDPVNIKSIYKNFTTEPFPKTFPLFSIGEYFLWRFTKYYTTVSLLNYVEYHKAEAVKVLEKELDYVNYPIKHYESVFTRFYQGYILPNKFKVDKRLPFFSTMIMSKQMTRDEAMQKLAEPAYDSELLQTDKEFVLKKLGFTEDEFESYMNATIHDHLDFSSITAIEHKLRKIKRAIFK
ncbi:N-acetyl sugar amidotransferase [Aliarcobacter cryaerophilus]|uniref:N-acetyl sugar amidotransferase n=1 Tax=Aliarcobacter cryaerophilus TaxID=28198 RepID=UPI0021B6E14C|nr:N-acetyl sugar amidotransferase [Aliarcobacter cryaerophilus]MCT7487112.1 N-acetyl sugar amidotransferase [Aliarcobacter cryaerophilus]MCT7491574.1 N-acetyl sugar amidotransferase [Aliarcobacter cryaerophilus]